MKKVLFCYLTKGYLIDVMKKLLIPNLLILFCFSQHLFAQKYDWALSVGSTVGETSGQTVISDGSGNVFMAGYYSGTVQFDPLGAGPTRTSQGGTQDLFISKYNVNGQNFVHAIGGSATGDDRVNDMTMDASGNVYVTGKFTGSANYFNPPIFINSNGGSDILIIKLDNTLGVTWFKNIGGTANDEGHGVTVDDAGNVYVTGSFQSAAMDFDPGVGSAIQGTTGGEDIFILKLDAAGNFVDVLTIGGLGNEQGLDIEYDGTNSLYLTGFFSSSVDFDPKGASAIQTSNGGRDIFISSYDSNLGYNWSLGAGGIGDDEGNELRLGVSNDVYVAGYYNGAGVSFGGGILLSSQGEDGFVAKYTALGSADWGFTIGGVGDDRALGIALDGCDNAYVSGYIVGTVDLDPSGATANYSSPATPHGYFVGKYDNAGGFVRAGTGGTAPLSSEARSIFVDELGTIFTTGLFASNALDVNLASGIANLSSVGITSDFFLSRHSQSEIIVSNLDDNGDGSLRNAITLANAQAGADTIRFCIPGPGPHIFSPNTPLPILTDDSTVIDGPSQAGYSLGILVLDGSGTAPGTAGLSLSGVTYCEIWGLTIQNFTDGISLSNADFNVIGGAGKENDISNNAQYAIFNNASSDNNLFSQNQIYCNAAGGIELAGAGNGGITAPIITVPDISGLDGTAPAGATVEIYTHDDTGCPGAPCQGKTLLGIVTADGSGLWYLPGPFTLGDQVTAIAISSVNNTSEFGLCQTVDAVLDAAPPILSLSETGTRHIQLHWFTDHNNDISGFEVEKLNAVGVFEVLAEIRGIANQHVFSYIDLNPTTGDNTYRIRQNLPDGSFQYSTAVNLTLAANEEFWVYPNPASQTLNIDFVLERIRPGGMTIRLLDHTGRQVDRLQSLQMSDHIQLPVDKLARGIYFLEVRLGSKLWEVRKIQLMP